MTTFEQYLTHETRRYFPEAKKITVKAFDDGENILITVDHEKYFWSCGSDDDWYIFKGTFNSFTIPFMPE